MILAQLRGTAMTATTAPQVEKPTIWQIDPAHTLVEFAVKHMMFTTVKGRFGGVHGTIVDDAADPSRSSVEVEIDAASIDTREEKRDAHLRSPDFLDVESYPTITFKSSRVEHAGQDRLRVIGDLTIHGNTREVVLDTTINGRGTNPFGLEVAGFSGETTINRRDFGLNWNMALEAGGVLVGDTVKILLEIEAVKQS
jgi:polyisoprenoid-binding protein YceI